MNEALLNAKWIRKDISTPEGHEFARKTLNFMRERLSDYQELYGDLYNLEATPAESTAFRLAKHDKERYPNIITAKNDLNVPYYTNSSHLPVGYTDSISEALNIQDGLQTLYTSGTVFHAFLGQRLPSWKVAANLVRKIAENYQLPYFTMSPTYSVCKTHGYIIGEAPTCQNAEKKRKSIAESLATIAQLKIGTTENAPNLVNEKFITSRKTSTLAMPRFLAKKNSQKKSLFV